jgi:hypothetical protein
MLMTMTMRRVASSHVRCKRGDRDGGQIGERLGNGKGERGGEGG